MLWIHLINLKFTCPLYTKVNFFLALSMITKELHKPTPNWVTLSLSKFVQKYKKFQIFYKTLKRNILMVKSYMNLFPKYLHVALLKWKSVKLWIKCHTLTLSPKPNNMKTTNNQRASGTCDWQLCRPDVLQSRLQTAWAQRVKSAQGTLSPACCAPAGRGRQLGRTTGRPSTHPITARYLLGSAPWPAEELVAVPGPGPWPRRWSWIWAPHRGVRWGAPVPPWGPGAWSWPAAPSTRCRTGTTVVLLHTNVGILTL